MGFLSRIRQYNTVRVYNDMRRSLAVLSVGFIVGGIVGLLGFGDTRSSGQLAEGTERLIVLLLFIVLGILLGLLRLTVFPESASVGVRCADPWGRTFELATTHRLTPRFSGPSARAARTRPLSVSVNWTAHG